MDLFEFNAKQSIDASRPLAEKMRPENLEEFMGQRHAAGKNSMLYHAIKHDRIFSMVLWGPPGCGKTTLARLIARETDSYFDQFSAVLSGIKQIRDVVEEAKNQQNLYRKKTILFVDEIHRFNKAQQDAFLQHVESGLLTLIGATTQNPSFEVIPALMSRCRVITLNSLSSENMAAIVNRALKNKTKGLGSLNVKLTKDAIDYIIQISQGDARCALNSLEIATSIFTAKNESSDSKTVSINTNDLETALQKKALLYDKSGEEHYNLISAFHKSMRGSDPDAAIYWLVRMLDAGEDPLYIARRMVRFASEDVGNAEPAAIKVALSAVEAFRFLGHPEGDLALVQAAAYLATAPKSNSLYLALNSARKDVDQSGPLPVPYNIRNAPTNLMKNMGYGKNYKYAHDYKDACAVQDYLPDRLKKKIYYNPTESGYEKTIKSRLDKWRALKEKIRKS